MDDTEVLAASAGLRRELADWLGGLTPAQVETPSLCVGWRVREVAGHLLTPVTVSTPRMALRLVRSRLSLDAAMDHYARTLSSGDFATVVTRLRDRADVPFTPPGGGPQGPLTDLLVHEGDMRVPLGLALRDEPRLGRVAMDFLATSPGAFVPRGRLDGLRLVATGATGATEATDGTAGGTRTWGPDDGAEVIGALPDLLMVACGRRALLERVTGPGAALLAARD